MRPDIRDGHPAFLVPPLHCDFGFGGRIFIPSVFTVLFITDSCCLLPHGHCCQSSFNFRIYLSLFVYYKVSHIRVWACHRCYLIIDASPTYRLWGGLGSPWEPKSRSRRRACFLVRRTRAATAPWLVPARQTLRSTKQLFESVKFGVGTQTSAGESRRWRTNSTA